VAVGAHADDLELGCFGTLALLKAKGASVTLITMTATPSVDHHGRVFRPNGGADALKGAAALGVSDVVVLSFRNNEVPYSRESIQELNKIFDERNADLVLTHWMWDNQQDHQNTANAVILAARHFQNIWMYEPNPGRPPVATTPFRPLVYVDISPYLALKLRAIRAHEGEYERLGGDRFFDQWEWRAKLRGAEVRVAAAEAFEPVKLLLNSFFPQPPASGAR
jgi:LmbE family N-acetylglucosaminyl deacetylase